MRVLNTKIKQKLHAHMWSVFPNGIGCHCYILHRKLEWIKRSYLSGRHVPCEFFVQVARGSRSLLFHESLSVSTPMLSVCSDFRVSWNYEGKVCCSEKSSKFIQTFWQVIGSAVSGCRSNVSLCHVCYRLVGGIDESWHLSAASVIQAG